MKLITEPNVFLVGRQIVNDVEVVRFLQSEEVASWTTDAPSDGEELVECAGRLCYHSYAKPRPGGNKAYIEHILEVQHGSVLEHAVWNFIFTGISRSLTHELIRHRAGFGFSELSQRYVDCSDVAFVVPPALMKYHTDWEDYRQAERENKSLGRRPSKPGWSDFEHWVRRRRDDLEEYEFWTKKLTADAPPELSGTDKRKWARQAARSVLPNCTETKIFVTANARSLRHFIEMRGSRHADTEIRNLAIALLRVMQTEAPNIFGDYKIEPLPDGTFEAATEWRKV